MGMTPREAKRVTDRLKQVDREREQDRSKQPSRIVWWVSLTVLIIIFVVAWFIKGGV